MIFVCIGAETVEFNLHPQSTVFNQNNKHLNNIVYINVFCVCICVYAYAFSLNLRY